MKVKTTRWRPDTCGCVLEYSWDADLPDELREHTDPVVVEACERHGHDDAELVHIAALTDNAQKNRVFEELQKAHPDLEPGDFEYDFAGGELAYRVKGKAIAAQLADRIARDLGGRVKRE